jgi:D-glycero-D-manno-heptose 1,7-bisphosphate phosphatase
MRRALFLDRDGIINVNHGYVHRIEQFEFMPGIFDLVRFALHELGWHVVVTTNQSGIGRGYFSEADFDALTQWMCERFAAENAPLTRVYHCPYHAEHGIGPYRIDHPWRKPRPGMMLQAAADYGIDLAGSAVVGDSVSDIEAAEAAGIGLRLLLDPSGASVATGKYQAVRSLAEALAVIRGQSSG